MARTQAKVLVTIWSGEDWRATSSGAQRLYLLLLSQSRLNLAGCLDLMPARWASLAPDTTTEQIEQHLVELERRQFVAVDRDTEELAVRTFTEHDLAAGALNRNLLKGFWSAWAGVMSAVLRKVIIDALPEVVWDKSSESTPCEALHMRSTSRLELPLQQQSEPPSEPDSVIRFDPSVSFSSTATTTVTDTAATGEPEIPASNQATPDPDGGNPMRDAAKILAEAEADRRGAEIGNRDGYVRSRLTPLVRDNEPTWRAMLQQDPTLTGTELAGRRTRERPADMEAARQRSLAEARATSKRLAELESTVREPPPERPANIANLRHARTPDDAA